MEKIVVGVRLSNALIEQLDAWRASQTVGSSRPAVIAKALEEFLERERKGKKKK